MDEQEVRDPTAEAMREHTAQRDEALHEALQEDAAVLAEEATDAGAESDEQAPDALAAYTATPAEDAFTVDLVDDDEIKLIRLTDNVAEVDFLFHPSHAPWIAEQIMARYNELMGTTTPEPVEHPFDLVDYEAPTDPGLVAEPFAPAAPQVSSNPTGNPFV